MQNETKGEKRRQINRQKDRQEGEEEDRHRKSGCRKMMSCFDVTLFLQSRIRLCLLTEMPDSLGITPAMSSKSDTRD